MSSPSPIPEDETGCHELDHLVRRALRALISKQAPPERVWKQIKAQLERGKCLHGGHRDARPTFCTKN